MENSKPNNDQPDDLNEQSLKFRRELDEILQRTLRGSSAPPAPEAQYPYVELDEEDRAFVERIMDSVTTGSKGIFVVLHPNDRMQYMLLNTNRAGAIALLAKVMQRTAEALADDLDN